MENVFDDFEDLMEIENEGLKRVVGGFTLHTVTVIPLGDKSFDPEGDESQGTKDDGDDGIHND